MNIERFHNELAMRLGYERIVKDKIAIETSEEPMVTLRLGYENDIGFVLGLAQYETGCCTDDKL